MEWKDRSPEELWEPVKAQPTALGELGGLHLEPSCDCLETLEIMEGRIHIHPHAPPSPLELSSLRHLYVGGKRYSYNDAALLSWLLLPRATSIHLAEFDLHRGLKLCPIITTIDRLCLRQLTNYRPRSDTNNYRVQCFAGDIERLLIDTCRIFADTPRGPFLELFDRANAPVTHLVLFLLSPEHGSPQGVDLQPFPHLVHLDVNGSDVGTTAHMLQQPTDTRSQLERTSWPAVEPPYPCLKLAELVITCGSFVHSTSDPRGYIDPGAIVDEPFQRHCAVLQQVLADRAAAHGTRLTYLAVSVRSMTVLFKPELFYTGARYEVTDTGDGWQQQNVDSILENVGWSTSSSWDDWGIPSCSDGPGKDLDDGSSGLRGSLETTTVKSDPIYPGQAARDSALQSLQKMVDGPVVMKLLDSAGDEMSVGEA